MDGLIWGAIGLGILILFLMFGTNFGKDPTKKTDAQLQREYRLHQRVLSTLDPGTERFGRALEDANRVKEEIERRSAGQMQTGVIEKINQITSTIGKIKVDIEVIKRDITKGNESNNEHLREYYLGYIYGVAQAMCHEDGVESNHVYMTPVYQEAKRLFGFEDSDLFSSVPKKISEILLSESGSKGNQDGTVDGDYVAKPINPPPYFDRIRLEFAGL